ncbi:agmatinase [Vallitalea guaymasensis]|uniref:agmatinase n=1 Tax=Vallitalea guaymasensis TaxID=1185412 RepID=UPI002ED2E74F
MVMLDKKSICEYEGINSTYHDADIVICGVPFDGTCSNRPGTRFGPDGVRAEIDGLETYSPYQDEDMIDYNYVDVGNIEIPIGSTSKTMGCIHENIKSILADNKKIITLGGEHLISYPIVKAFAEKYSNLHVVHLDAHADLRSDYLEEKLSHATVMRRIHETLDKGYIFQYGIRSGTKEEFQFAGEYTKLQAFNLNGIEKVKSMVGNAPVYLSIDLDVLDPSIFPGTGTPEPGGIDFNELINGIISLKDVNIVGADIVELSPHYDLSGVSNIVAAKTLREVAIIMSKREEHLYE